mgnify:FL=1
MLAGVSIPTIKRLIVFCAIFCCLGTHAQASSLTEVLDTAERLDLASHPTWLKLLHYERAGKQSVVLTDSFFLSPNGKDDPRAELTSTINAYFLSWGENVNEHARCRFPARYFWLSQQLQLPDYNLREPKCERLENWALFDSVNSISLLLVSGYFGNPASTFGHALLKLNTDSVDDQSGLFDLTVGYGALVPENEYILRYVARGLGGGYKAGFSDKYFYTQDLVYSRTEFRDIWDYRLELTDYERTLLILHIWEILGNKFTYYFLDKNCAYRLAELADLVIEEDLLDNGHFWYLPVELFHRLNDIDMDRQKSSGRKLIQSIRFVPSSQRKFYHQLKLLTPDELKAFNVILREGINSMSIHLAKFTNDRQILVLDALLAYQQYRLIAEEPEPSRNRREVKDQILLARLQLPSYLPPPLKIPELPSPAKGSRPMEFGVSIAGDTNEEPFLRLTWSPFKQELVGQNSLEGDELVVFDLAVGLLEDGHKAFVDKFDLIRILDLNTLSVQAEDESQLSWQLRVGTTRIERNGEDYYDGILSFGAGKAWKWNEIITGYGMVDLAAHSLSPFVRVRPHLGLKFDLGELRTWLYFGAESVSYKAEFFEIWGGKMQYQLNDRYAIHFELSNENATRASAGLNWYW